MLNEVQFRVARCLAEGKPFALEDLYKGLDIPQDTIQKTCEELKELGILSEKFEVTKAGYEALSPYKVDNAIILAAGMATRFVPVSYEIPKGLIKVKGEPLIERQIRQLNEVGINEIVIVVGYMMEKFLYLRDKYNVKFVVNNEFAEKNTHSSIYAARDYMKNTLVLCADNYYPDNMFKKYEYRTYYCSVFLPGIGYTERSLVTDDEGLVVDTNKPSRDEWILYGHAYWDKSFSENFRPILEEYYGRPGIENYYWETIWSENLAACPMWIKRCTNEEILEFDSVSELEAFDPNYILNNGTSIMENICSVLACSPKDVCDFKPVKTGLNNRSFSFECMGERYIYRHPGKNAEGIIDRKKEAYVTKCVKDLGIDTTLVHIDETRGWKISKFVETKGGFDFANTEHVSALAKHLKKLHSANIDTGSSFSYLEEANKLIEIIKRGDYDSYLSIEKIKEKVEPIFEELVKDGWQVSLCHNDIYEPNLLVGETEISLIDWEFAGDSDIGYDICKLFACLNPKFEDIDKYLKLYYGREATGQEKKHLIGCAAVIYYYWFVWGIYASKNGTAIQDYIMNWYEKMNSFTEAYMALSI